MPSLARDLAGDRIRVRGLDRGLKSSPYTQEVLDKRSLWLLFIVPTAAAALARWAVLTGAHTLQDMSNRNDLPQSWKLDAQDQGVGRAGPWLPVGSLPSLRVRTSVRVPADCIRPS